MHYFFNTSLSNKNKRHSEKHYNRNERELKTVEQTDGKEALEEKDSEGIEKRKL